MDLMNIGTTKETTDVTLYNPVNSEILTNEDRSEMTITVHGPYSKKYKPISHAQQNRRLMKAQRLVVSSTSLLRKLRHPH